MMFAWRAPALVWAIGALFAAPVCAQEWATSAASTNGLYETDVSTLSIKEEVVKSWVRETLAHPRRDEQTHKSFVTTLSQRSDDCERRQFAMGSYVRRDQMGQAAGSGMTGGGWQTVVPGSVAESIWKLACAAAHPPKIEPWLTTLSDGEWKALGQSADRKYGLSVKTDQIFKLDNGYVFSLARSDYAAPEWIDGFAVRYIVAGSVTDCVNEKNAPAGVDAYVSPSLRVQSIRSDPKTLKFVPLAPGSFLSNNLKAVCDSAKTLKASGPAAKGDGNELFTGTAWGVSKGYLITASHVVEGARRIFVYSNGERVAEARVVLEDPANDLALLKFTKPMAAKLKALPLADRGAVLGKNIFTLGYPEPGVLGQSIKMTAGQVSSTSGAHDDTRLLQISVPIQPGNSGGPVMGWDGSVVAVVQSKLLRFDDEEESPAPDGVNYAVKASYIRPMLDDLPDLGNYEMVTPMPQQEQMVAAARQAVFMLLVTKAATAQASDLHR